MGIQYASYNIHDYVKDTNIGFDEQGFNEIDGLVLTQISNMDLGSSGIDLYSGESKSFTEIWSEMNIEGTAAHAAYLRMSPNNQKLIQELADSARYKDISVSNFIKDPAKSGIVGFPSVGIDQHMEQFAAVTITYEQDGNTYNYVSYRATDSSSDGWAEDLAMLYSMGTQAQSDSTTYMNIIAEMTEGYITGGGHSKGGGDFEYAYLFCNDEVRNRIIKGYVYDSPGLSEEVLSNTAYYEQYKQITDGTFICPQDSIIGQVLHEGDNAVFVHSVESGFNEHDPYSWEIDASSHNFVLDKQTELSKYLNTALDTSVANMSHEEKEAFFAFVSYLLYNSGEDGIDGLGKLFASGWKNEDGSTNWGKLSEIWDVLSEGWSAMTPKERYAFLNSLGSVFAGFATTTYDYVKIKFEQWIDEKKHQIEQKFRDAWIAASNWFIEKRNQFRNFLENAYKSVVSHLDKVVSWFRSMSSGGRYASTNPQIKLDTYKLRSYAQRIQAVNRRISNLDYRLDSLYWKVGLLDLWNLMQADLLTSYSWRLDRCASYLNETANDFDSVESELISVL